MKDICSVEGCERPTKTRGWCGTHYMRWRRHGDPTVKITQHGMALEERLWALINKTDGCWLWMGNLDKRGYGHLYSIKGSTHQAHRLVYEVLVGPIPDGYDVDHLCHVPGECLANDDCPHRRCVRPDHLAAVTRKANTLRSNSPSAKNAAKTHCKWGHPLDGDNLTSRKGGRRCKTCSKEKTRRYRERLAKAT